MYSHCTAKPHGLQVSFQKHLRSDDKRLFMVKWSKFHILVECGGFECIVREKRILFSCFIVKCSCAQTISEARTSV